MLLVSLGAESRMLVKRSELAVAPPTGYLPSAEEDYDSLAGYSADTFSLPGYSEDTEGLAQARDSDGLTTTITALLETTTNLEEDQDGGDITTTISAGGEVQ